MSLTTEIEITPFKADDAFAMTLTEQATQSFAGVDLRENFALYEQKGPAWTMRIGGDIIGCAGLMFPWPSGPLALAWLLPSPQLPGYPKPAILSLLTQLRTLIHQYQPRRIEFLVAANFSMGQRFAEFLGFRRDGCHEPPCPTCGLVQAYGPHGEDYVRYIWIADAT